MGDGGVTDQARRLPPLQRWIRALRTALTPPWRLAVALLATVALAGGAIAVFAGRDRADPRGLPPDVVALARTRSSDDPVTTPLPPPDDREALRRYLRGEGRAVVELHDAARRLLTPASPTRADCDAVAATVQRQAGTPSMVLARAGAAPDDVMRDLAVNEARTTSRVLGVCGGSDGAGYRADLAYEWVLVQRHLIAAGVS